MTLSRSVSRDRDRNEIENIDNRHQKEGMMEDNEKEKAKENNEISNDDKRDQREQRNKNKSKSKRKHKDKHKSKDKKRDKKRKEKVESIIESDNKFCTAEELLYYRQYYQKFYNVDQQMFSTPQGYCVYKVLLCFVFFCCVFCI